LDGQIRLLIIATNSLIIKVKFVTPGNPAVAIRQLV
jgi:hypothetical protein